MIRIIAVVAALLVGRDLHADTALRAVEAMRQATRFFRTEVATEGGYLWTYKHDLSLREGGIGVRGRRFRDLLVHHRPLGQIS